LHSRKVFIKKPKLNFCEKFFFFIEISIQTIKGLVLDHISKKIHVSMLHGLEVKAKFSGELPLSAPTSVAIYNYSH
jgi:hypothetical protein